MPNQPGVDPDTEQARLEELFKSAEQKIADSQKSAQEASSLDDFDRSIIGRIVMYVYAGAIVAGFVLFAIRAWHATGQDDWAGIMKDAGDLIKTGVVPIVTLVLGYYFGKSGKS